MSEKGDNILQFNNYQYCHPVPYIIYADVESLIVGMDQVHTKNRTKKIAHHEACDYGNHIISPDRKHAKKINVYRGPNAVQKFLEALLKEEKELAKILTTIVPIKMTSQDEENP